METVPFSDLGYNNKSLSTRLGSQYYVIILTFIIKTFGKSKYRKNLSDIIIRTKSTGETFFFSCASEIMKCTSKCFSRHCTISTSVACSNFSFPLIQSNTSPGRSASVSINCIVRVSTLNVCPGFSKIPSSSTVPAAALAPILSIKSSQPLLRTSVPGH